MKLNFSILFSFIFLLCSSQTNTEIFLYDIAVNQSKIQVINGKNLSNNHGYDNQPSFIDNNTILFASTRNEQTDIASYSLESNLKTFINATEGSEYTPLKIPNQDAVSAVRLDKDGMQRLYSYSINDGKSTVLIKDLVVAYYTWYNTNIVVSAVIEGEQLNLYSTNIKEKTSRNLATNVGRSFHRIPNSNLISFISKANAKQWQIKSLNPLTGKTRLIANTIQGVEDICWLDDKNLLSGKEGVLYKLRLQKDNNWKKVKDLTDDGIVNITRLATNTKGSKLLITGELAENSNSSIMMDTNLQLIETQASQIVDRHIDPFNKRNLTAFSNAFNVNVIVKRFPAEIMYYGRDKLKANYKLFFENNEKSNVKVLNRISLRNVVIDEELIALNNSTKRQVTIYETDENEITTMTFIANSKLKKKQETLINEQLKKYNEKDVKAYGRTFATNVEINKFPNEILIEGRPALRDQYITLLKNTPNLYSEILNRIIIGNKVIDKIKRTINDETVYNVAIYEIENGLISKVTFIQ